MLDSPKLEIQIGHVALFRGRCEITSINYGNEGATTFLHKNSQLRFPTALFSAGTENLLFYDGTLVKLKRTLKWSTEKCQNVLQFWCCDLRFFYALA